MGVGGNESPLRGRGAFTAAPQTWTAETTIKLAPPWERLTDRKTDSKGLRWKQTLNSPGLPRGDPRPAPTPGRWAETPEASVPLAWSNPASGSAFVTCSSASHGHRCRAAASARGGKPRPPQPPLPALLPSLPLPRPPSLSPSLARCRSRGPPAGNLFWTKSRYLRKREKKKGPLMWKRKKERPLTAFIFHALTIGRPQFGHPGPSPAAAEVCRACCLAHAGCRALRTARSTLWAAAPQQPQHQTDLKVLPTDSTSGGPPRRGPLLGSPL
ncbi:uncharacterized protein LOC125130341 [Phacochoerus africanus]|uniref:uncharacterized protein LOC125130341 n=1 Tax=Phacochoerus africanus TaxID=41426 RepID=UPI001FD9A585|nr:uncharacterized protein LOC125130341 [Phacochoerus africanus]